VRRVEPWSAAEQREGGGYFRWLRTVAREPFCHFLVLAVLTWLCLSYARALTQRYVIHITPAQRERLALAYQQQYTQPPTAEQLQQLVERYITEEISVREGVTLHLDRDDEIVRRRIAQKFQFLQTDLSVPQDPAPEVLENWFRRNQTRYVTAPRVSFAQIYFSPDRGGDALAEARARNALNRLSHAGTARASQLGDPFPVPSTAVALEPDAVERLLGRSELSRELFTAPVAQWLGPIRSGYGWHIIYVTARRPSQPAVFDEIRSRVLADYIEEQREVLNAQAIEKLRAKYTIIREEAPP
jgi:peptidyl-prolyl cis-trans isomerase C